MRASLAAHAPGRQAELLLDKPSDRMRRQSQAKGGIKQVGVRQQTNDMDDPPIFAANP